MYLVEETASDVNLSLNQNFLGRLYIMGHYVLFLKYIVKLLNANFWRIKNILR